MSDPPDLLADERRLSEHAARLADGVEAAVPGWVERSVARLLTAWGAPVDDTAVEAMRFAGAQSQADVGPRVRALLAADIDAQVESPLAVIRSAVVYPTRVLADLGVPHVVRDAVAERQFPDDVYDLSPASFADVDPALQELGLVWGAAKAHVHLARRRTEGRR